MNVFAIYQVNEHLAALMAEAHAERLARTVKPRRSLRLIVASLFSFRGSFAATPA